MIEESISVRCVDIYIIEDKKLYDMIFSIDSENDKYFHLIRYNTSIHKIEEPFRWLDREEYLFWISYLVKKGTELLNSVNLNLSFRNYDAMLRYIYSHLDDFINEAYKSANVS